MSTKQTAIIFLDRTSLYFYENGQNAALRLDFPTTALRDLEIISSDIFEAQIQSFIKTNKLVPAGIVFVLSENIFFEKEFPQQAAEAEMQHFLEYIPFEEVSFKKIPTTTGTRILACNKEVYEKVIKVFEQSQFSLLCILPATVFGTPIQTLDTNTIKVIYAKYEALKTFTIVAYIPPIPSVKTATPGQAAEQAAPTTQLVPEQKKEKKKNSSLIFLIPIFVLLIIVLVFLFLRMNAENATSATPKKIPTTTTTK